MTIAFACQNTTKRSTNEKVGSLAEAYPCDLQMSVALGLSEIAVPMSHSFGFNWNKSLRAPNMEPKGNDIRCACLLVRWHLHSECLNADLLARKFIPTARRRALAQILVSLSSIISSSQSKCAMLLLPLPPTQANTFTARWIDKSNEKCRMSQKG